MLKPWVTARPAPNGIGKTLRANLDRVTLCYIRFRMFSLGRRVQPATMIGFKQIEFFDHTGFDKATVSAWRVALEASGLGSISINVRITAVRKLGGEG